MVWSSINTGGVILTPQFLLCIGYDDDSDDDDDDDDIIIIMTLFTLDYAHYILYIQLNNLENY